MSRTRVIIGVLLLVIVVQALALAYLLQTNTQPASTLTVTVTSAGVPLTGVEGRVVVYRAGQRQPYANGQVGQALPLAPDSYDLRVVLTGAAGGPAGRLTGVPVAADSAAQASVEVPVGELLTTIDAPSSGRVLVQVFAEGKHDRVIAAPNPGTRILLSPGRYDVRAAYIRDNEEKDVRWIEGVAVEAGLLTAPAATFPRSQLLVNAEANGRTLESALVEVTVYRAGDDMLQIVESGTAGIPIELNPGVYDVEAQLLSAADRPVRSIDSVVLSEGETTEGRVVFETATVITQANQAAGAGLGDYDAYVYFYDPADHTQAIVYAPAGQPVVLSAGTYDLRANYFRSADQPDVWLRGVDLVAGEQRHVPFSFPSGSLIVRAFDATGEELLGDSAIIRVYSDESRAVPVAISRGGEIRVLSAGSYDIAVEDTRNAVVRWLDDTEVVAGELTERSARSLPGPN